MQQEVQWGTREMSEEMQERLRQYLASRSEIIAGDQIVLKHLRNDGKTTPTFLVGHPISGIGLFGVSTLARLRKKTK